MRMLVDQSRGDMLAGSVDDFGIGIAQTFTDLCDLTIFDEYICILEFALCITGPDGRIADQQVLCGRLFRPTIGQEGIVDLSEARGRFLFDRIRFSDGGVLQRSRPGDFIPCGILSIAIPFCSIAEATETELASGALSGAKLIFTIRPS